MTVLLVALGAAVGAPLRYLVDRAVQTRHDTAFPWGTFTVNVSACLVLGVITGGVVAGSASRSVAALLGIGLCGALSTYSTFAYESVGLARGGSRGVAAVNVAASLGAGLAAAFVGAGLAQAIWR